ncbi:MAG: hypothetical protein QXW18_06295 [Candidatus Bathyarchaeia archaeon]
MTKSIKDEIQTVILRALSESMTGKIQLRVPINSATGRFYLIIIAEKGQLIKIEKETPK